LDFSAMTLRVPFDKQRYLSINGGVFKTSYPVYDANGKCKKRCLLNIPRKKILQRKDELYQQWQAEGRTDFRGILNAATTLAVREEIERQTKTIRKVKKGI